MRCLIYPAPEKNPPPLPHQTASSSTHPNDIALPLAVTFNEETQLAGIRPYIPGDTPRQLAWKAMARQADDRLLSQLREHTPQHGNSQTLWLDWHSLPAHLDTETRLARLTAWVLAAEADPTQILRYGVRLPHVTLEPDRGHTHQANCLRALALL